MTRFAPRLVVALAIGALAVLPASAHAAIQLATPAADLVTKTSRPTFTWTFAEREQPSVLHVGRVPAMDGDLPVEGALFEQLAAGSTSFQPTRAQQLYAGRWYWRVIAATADGADASSAYGFFTIAPRVLRPTLRLASTVRGTDGTLRINTNTADTRVNVKVYHGRAGCLNQSFTATRARALLHRWSAYRVYCFPSTALAVGTRVTTVVTIRSAGIARRVVHRSVVR